LSLLLCYLLLQSLSLLQNEVLPCDNKKKQSFSSLVCGSYHVTTGKHHKKKSQVFFVEWGHLTQ
jgi:hypothetical protein